MQRQVNENELNDFYFLIGKAIWHMQYVEEALGYLYLFLVKKPERNSLSQKEADAILSSIQKNTLGKLINELIKSDAINNSLSTRLETFNSERRWLVHKCVIESGDELYNSQGRHQVFTRLNSFIREAITLQSLINKTKDEFFASLGVDVSEFNRQAQQDLNKLKGLA